jgi:small neutral amino acid transporter SnatA (MarC family)
MTLWFVLAAMVAAVNPARVAVALAATPGRDRRRPLVLATLVAGAVLVFLGASGSWLLDVLDVTDETWRIAAGAVAVLAGARHLVFPIMAVPQVTAPVHAVVPVAFPVLLVPEVIVVSVLVGATEGIGVAMLGAAAGLGSAMVGGVVGDSASTRGGARLLAAMLVVVGVAAIIAGIRDV